MSSDDDIRTEDVARAVEVAREHEARAALGALAFDVMSRQAEGESLFAGKEWVSARATEHEVERDMANTRLGNVVEVLERGPETSLERALVAAFAVIGVGDRLTKLADNDTSMLSRFVRHADWLETCSPYAVYAFVDPLLDDDTRTRVWNALADACVGAPPASVRHRARARAAVRISALAASRTDAAKEGLTRVARHAQDPSIRALAAFAVGDMPSAASVASTSGGSAVRGRVGRPRGGYAIETMRIVFGVAAVTWVVRMLGALVGVVHTRDVSLAPTGIDVVSETRLLGRVVRSRAESFSINGLASVAEAARFPIVHALVGLTCLGVGLLAGGLLAFDAVRSGETWVLLIAGLSIALGAGADLALEVLVPKKRHRVALELGVLPDRTLRVDDVPASDAGRFLAAVKQRFT